jgi:hypothetical protein
MSSESASFRRVSSTSSRLIESYCSACGLFIAASPNLGTIEIMENLHECQAALTGASRQNVDSLMRELAAKEGELLNWIQSSQRNTRWFASDPVSAIRAAKLGIDEHILEQLEMITLSIAHKLRSAN